MTASFSSRRRHTRYWRDWSSDVCSSDLADAYCRVLEAFGPERPVVIRLADIGGDKAIPYLHLAPEQNPFLGVRAIRLAYANPDLLLTQLRAIWRAGGDVRGSERRRELDPGQLVHLGEEQGRPLSLGDPPERPLELAGESRLHGDALRGWRGPARLARPGDEVDDLPAADLVERDPVGDLVEPGACLGGILQAGVPAIGPDEGVLGEVRGELRIAQHPDQVRVDLPVMAREEPFDEGARRDRIGRQRIAGLLDGSEVRVGIPLVGSQRRRPRVAGQAHRPDPPATRDVDDHRCSGSKTEWRGSSPRSGRMTRQ